MYAKTLAAAFASLGMLAAVGCDGKQPSRGITAPSVAAPVVKSLTITGKTTSAGVDSYSRPWLGMVPGETARLTATATLTDGSERDVTTEVAWASDTDYVEDVLSVSGPGMVNATVFGWGTVLATDGTAHAAARVRVSPEGVFLLDVVVGDAQWAMGDVIVQVSSAAGMFSAKTAVWGIVTLPAIGETTVQASKAGYATITQSVTVGKDQAVQCTLRPSGTD